MFKMLDFVFTDNIYHRPQADNWRAQGL